MGPSEARLKVFGAPFFKKARPCPYRRQPKKKPATGADAPVRAIATGAAGGAGSLPSQSPNGDSSPKGGAKSRLPLWGRCPPVGGGEGKLPAAPSHGLCGSADGRPSQSPNGDSVSAAASVGRWATSHRDVAAPKGGAKYVRYQKLAQSQVSPPPLGEVSCQRHDGEGSVKPPSWCATGREKRCAVSLAFFCALRAYKVKVETFL